jgi:hypothetical protein
MMKKTGSTKVATPGEEMVGLVSPSIAATASSRTLKQVLIILVVGCLSLFVWDSLEWDAETGDVAVKLHQGKPQETIKPADDSITTPEPTPTPAPAEIIPPGMFSEACEQQCDIPPPPQEERFGGQDLTSAKIMLERLQQYRQIWIDQTLRKQYGDYYHDIFEPLVDGERVFVGREQIFKNPNALPEPGHPADPKATGPGWARMVRKYEIKLLQIQLAILQEKITPKRHCLEHCQAGLQDGLYSRFTWVNGGHSASAGHGNFFRESYTAVLSRDLQPLLAEIGLDWVAKNYAMGGTASGEEVALCFNSIFGRDVDSISWDYGMTDGGDYYKMALYAYRAARLALVEDSVSQPGHIRHRPSFFGIQAGDTHTYMLRLFQTLGMTVLAMDKQFSTETIVPAFPNMMGMTDAEIAALPPYVQYFRCENSVETGDPGCGENKFNASMCNERAARTSWHPGWKYHALEGHWLAATIMEVLADSLQELIKLEPTTPETLEQKHARLEVQLKMLDAAEQADYENIFKSPTPQYLLDKFNENLWRTEPIDENKQAMQHMSLEMLIKEPSFCHTAMLPAEIRFQGLLTENPQLVGDIARQNYEFGIFQSQIAAFEHDGDNVFANNRTGHEQDMVIGMKDDEHQVCPELLNADYKDYFLVTSKESYRSQVFPNAAERAHYTEFDPEKSHGWLFICMTKCDWGNCPDGDIRKNIMAFTTDEKYGGIEMEVNHERVTGVNCLNECCALKHEHADEKLQFLWRPQDGKYEFRARIIDGTEWGYARISSFIAM